MIVLFAAVAGLCCASPAQAVSWVTLPGNVTFPTVALNGRDQVTAAALGLDVTDNSAPPAGWAIAMTSTSLTSGSGTFPAQSVTVPTPPTTACDAGVLCTPAVTTVSYPYVLPSGTQAPTATKMFNAAAGTGSLAQTVTATFNLAVPANMVTGVYSSTWTITLSSGP